MRAKLILTALAAGCVCAGATAGEYDYYKHLRYPKGLVPGVGRDKVEPEGGPNAVGYHRRTVQWWPRKGQDIVDIPEGVPLRTWTRNKGQEDKEALAGVCRTWTASDPETFKAHLIAFRSFGTSAPDSDRSKAHIPAAVLRLENGEQRAVINYGPVSRMISKEDHAFIHEIWEKEYPKLHAKISQQDNLSGKNESGAGLKHWTEGSPKLHLIQPRDGNAKYPRWGWRGDTLIFETAHFHLMARPEHWGRPATWIRPEDTKAQNRYRTHIMEYLENFWTYVEAAGASMPYWRRHGDNYKYVIHIHRSRCAGGWGHCGIGDCNPVAFGHEFFHGQPLGGWGGEAETMCNAGQHTALPGELQMFNGNFRYPWRNVMHMGYQSSLWFFVLSDNPNWGYGIQVVAGCLSSPGEPTPYHTVARLGQKKGLWKNGIKGFGDFFGEYAARMVTCDFVEQVAIRSKYGMPEMSYVYPVYGHKNRYRISNAEAPRWCGYNIVRLVAAEDIKEITVDFQGIHDPALHSDWRACIVAVDADGQARYSPLWSKGKMAFVLEPSDKHLWLTVSACPSAFPTPEPGQPRMSFRNMFLAGVHAPRYPWEVTLTGCEPGTPHRRQGDIENFDELYGRCDFDNTYLNYPVKQEEPIPLTEKDGELAQEKLAAMLPRIEASSKTLEEKIQSGRYHRGYFEDKKTMALGDLARRVKFLQENARGHRHPNGGGFVSDNAHVSPTAYVGPNAMVLDGATVKDNACIEEFAVVLGPKTVILGNAKVGGRAWVVGDLKVSGDARILEAATVTTIFRTPRTPSVRHEGQAEITGSAVIKGEPLLLLSFATGQTITGGVVLDYEPDVNNRKSGVFKHGRFYQPNPRFDRAPSLSGGVDAGALYANWQFNQPKTVLLEDSYVNNNGILHGTPSFANDGGRKCIVFNGKDQYAEAPPSVADFGELTIDMMVNRSGGKGGRLFDFGTGEEECFYLAIDSRSGKLTLTARHHGKTYTVAASQGIPAGKWVRVRVEMNGSAAAIHIDGKQVATRGFAFRPRSVFIGDRPEGNFIACGRNQDEFFKGAMDHFRIYRKVHADFNALGPAPSALTQMHEWSESDQQRHDEWEGQRKAKEAELNAGKCGDLQNEIKKRQQQKAALYKVANLAELETRVRDADKAKNDLERKIHDEYRALPGTVKNEQEIKGLSEEIDGIARRIRESSQYVKLTEEIKACEQKRGQVDGEVRNSPKLKAISAKTEAANEAKAKIEERIKHLPELKKLAQLSEKEEDNQKKRELQDEYNRLLGVRKSSDPQWQKAGIAIRDLGNLYNETLRNETEVHAGRIELESRLRRLREDLKTLNARLLESHPEYSKLLASRSAKQQALGEKRKQIEQRIRSSVSYKNAEAARVAARKAIDDQRKRIVEAKSADAAKLDARIAKLHEQSQVVRNNALKSAGLLGRNPYPCRSCSRA